MIPGHPEQLYAGLAAELERIKRLGLPEEGYLESCFSACMRYEQELSLWVRDFNFDTEEDEIYFFKTIRPLFTSQIEFYKKLYQSILFKPAGKTDQARFFEYEIDKVNRFLVDNTGFYQYYKNGLSSSDREYFLRSCPEESEADDPCRSGTGYDVLLATIQGVERYKQFVQEQLAKSGKQ